MAAYAENRKSSCIWLSTMRSRERPGKPGFEPPPTRESSHVLLVRHHGLTYTLLERRTQRPNS